MDLRTLLSNTYRKGMKAVGLGAQELKARHRDVMGESLMDMLRALTTPNMDIRKKTLDIALDLITARNIDEARSKPRPHNTAAYMPSLERVKSDLRHHCHTPAGPAGRTDACSGGCEGLWRLRACRW